MVVLKDKLRSKVCDSFAHSPRPKHPRWPSSRRRSKYCVQFRERSGRDGRQNGLTPLLLLRLARAGPPSPTLEVGLSLQPALAPQKFLNFLRRVRAIRSAKRSIACDERLSHRVSILGGNMLRRLLLLLLQWVAPQRHSSWGAKLSRGAVYHSCCWSLDLVRTVGLMDLMRPRAWGNGCLPCSYHRHPDVAQMRLQGY